MKPKIIFLISIFLLIIAIVFGVKYTKDKSASVETIPEIEEEKKPVEENTLNIPAQNNTETSAITKAYTLAEVATHGNTESCWTIVNNSVYDLTSWIKIHPGGAENILKICGKDGTLAFERQHGGKEKQEFKLETFLIGTYKKI
jgi:cytochrome b involved in lipid metabolism